MVTIELDKHEIRKLIEILTFSLAACPIESVSGDIQITQPDVEDLIDKLRRASK